MVSDMKHCPILSKHACCNKLNKFTKFEYYKEEDVKEFIKRVLDITPEQNILFENGVGEVISSTVHTEIKKLAGNKLTTQNTGATK